jgi:hypothetical protein
LGAARIGDVAAGQADVAKLIEIRAGLEKANQSYWAGQVEIQVLAAQAWIAQAQGKPEEALKFMRAAADLEVEQRGGRVRVELPRHSLAAISLSR